MIAWREKFRAVLVHFLVTLVMAAAAAALIFFVWYPDPFHAMLGGTKFFLLISFCDLVLGPLTSLIIYNSKKTRRALIFDYTVIAIVQLAAFVYGVVSIANGRPAYVAFVVDRFEVVRAGDLEEKDLQQAKEPYRTVPQFGPLLIATERPATAKEQNDLLFTTLGGKDIHHFPRYYVPYDAAREQVKKHAKPMEELYKKYPQARQMVAETGLGMPDSQLRWLPILGKTFWTALVDSNGGPPLAYIPIDPY